MCAESTDPEKVSRRGRGIPCCRVIGVTELDIVYLFLGLLALFVVIGALLPKYLPGLVRKLNSTVLKENTEQGGQH